MSNVENLMSAAHLFKVFPALLHFCQVQNAKARNAFTGESYWGSNTSVENASSSEALVI